MHLRDAQLLGLRQYARTVVLYCHKQDPILGVEKFAAVWVGGQVGQAKIVLDESGRI